MKISILPLLIVLGFAIIIPVEKKGLAPNSNTTLEVLDIMIEPETSVDDNCSKNGVCQCIATGACKFKFMSSCRIEFCSGNALEDDTDSTVDTDKLTILNVPCEL